MFSLLVRVCLILSLLLTAPAYSADRSKLNGALGTEARPPHVVSAQTYLPNEFRQRWVDRMSGGIGQHRSFRMVVDSKDRILVTDPLLAVVHVFDTREGTRYEIRGDRHCRLRMPTYIAVDADDNIYVTDLLRSAVVVLQSNGRFRQIIGANVFAAPTGIWVDSKNRILYAADWWKGEILSFDLAGGYLRSFGAYGGGLGQLRDPTDIVFHQGTLFVLDNGNFRFALFDSQGNFRAAWPFAVDRRPFAFAFDTADRLYYVDLYSGGLVVMDTNQKVLAGFEERPLEQRMQRLVPTPRFMSVAQDAARGKVLALRPTFEMHALTVVTDTAD